MTASDSRTGPDSRIAVGSIGSENGRGRGSERDLDRREASEDTEYVSVSVSSVNKIQVRADAPRLGAGCVLRETCSSSSSSSSRSRSRSRSGEGLMHKRVRGRLEQQTRRVGMRGNGLTMSWTNHQQSRLSAASSALNDANVPAMQGEKALQQTRSRFETWESKERSDDVIG